MVWAVVFYIVVYVDPETVKDVGVEGSYAPFVSAAALAVFYTVLTASHSPVLALVITVFSVLALFLAITQLMTLFTGIIIFLLILFSVYIHSRRDSVSKSDDGVR